MTTGRLAWSVHASYISEGWEDKAMEVIMRNLGYEINAVRSAIKTGQSHPTMYPQADVRKAGHNLDGAINLAVRLAAQLGRSIRHDNIVEARKVANSAKGFRKA